MKCLSDFASEIKTFENDIAIIINLVISHSCLRDVSTTTTGSRWMPWNASQVTEIGNYCRRTHFFFFFHLLISFSLLCFRASNQHAFQWYVLLLSWTLLKAHFSPLCARACAVECVCIHPFTVVPTSINLLCLILFIIICFYCYIEAMVVVVVQCNFSKNNKN